MNLKSPTPHERLRRARERAGYDSASDFARAANINYTTYAHHENGRRELRAETAALYARLLNLTPAQLLYGEQLPTHASVPIVNRLVASGKIETITERETKPQAAALPDPMALVGTIVCGNDLAPAYRNGDLVFHRPLRVGLFALDRLHGLDCLVLLGDGQQLLRLISVQADGRCTLIAANQAPLLDQMVIAAVPVEIVQRALPAGLTQH